MGSDKRQSRPEADRQQASEANPQADDETSGTDLPPASRSQNVFLVSGRVDSESFEEGQPEYEPDGKRTLRNLVEVKYSHTGRQSLFDAGDLLISKGQEVVIETDRGIELGEAMTDSKRTVLNVATGPRVLRRANSNDLRQEERNKQKEVAAMRLCKDLIGEMGLPMKLIHVEYLHGGNKAIAYFEAEGRVDFRRLVRELAQRLHVRMEMRQVGVRDASKIMGGVGPCGYALCCSSFLQDFAPVSIRMAKEQNLVLNPQKVSGVCGRLMCCLTYEDLAYKECLRGLPKVGKSVETPDGPGKVREIDVLRRIVAVQIEGGEDIKRFPADRIRPAGSPPPPPMESQPAEPAKAEPEEVSYREPDDHLKGEDLEGEEGVHDAEGPGQPSGEGSAPGHGRRHRRRRRRDRKPQGPGSPSMPPGGQGRPDDRRGSLPPRQAGNGTRPSGPPPGSPDRSSRPPSSGPTAPSKSKWPPPPTPTPLGEERRFHYQHQQDRSKDTRPERPDPLNRKK